MLEFDVLFNKIKSILQSKNDVLIAIIHLQCIQIGFLCVGTGSETFEDDEEDNEVKISELLPNGWNQSQDTYLLRYINPISTEKCLIKAKKGPNGLLISARICCEDPTVTACNVNADEFISNEFKTSKHVFISGNVDEVYQFLKVQIITKTFKRITSAMESLIWKNKFVAESEQRLHMNTLSDDSQLLFEEKSNIKLPSCSAIVLNEPNIHIGGADLDPFGQRKGGMTMDTRQLPSPFINPADRNRLPRGSPDPLQPIPQSFYTPTPDHFKPPGNDFNN